MTMLDQLILMLISIVNLQGGEQAQIFANEHELDHEIVNARVEYLRHQTGEVYHAYQNNSGN